MPVHGEYRHLSLHARLAESVGIPRNNIFVMEDGDILELNNQAARLAGRITAGNVYVDGLSVGDVGNAVLNDRRVLSRDGIAVVVIAINKDTGLLSGKPEVVSRGFVDNREAGQLLEKSCDYLIKLLTYDKPLTDWPLVSNNVKENLSNFFYEKTRRRPFIISVQVKV
jgi:ribonuclease J